MAQETASESAATTAAHVPGNPHCARASARGRRPSRPGLGVRAQERASSRARRLGQSIAAHRRFPRFGRRVGVAARRSVAAIGAAVEVGSHWRRRSHGRANGIPRGLQEPVVIRTVRPHRGRAANLAVGRVLTVRSLSAADRIGVQCTGANRRQTKPAIIFGATNWQRSNAG